MERRNWAHYKAMHHGYADNGKAEMMHAQAADASYNARMQSIWADQKATEAHYGKAASDAVAVAMAAPGLCSAFTGASVQSAQGDTAIGGIMAAAANAETAAMAEAREGAAQAQRTAATKRAAGAPDAAAAEEEALAYEMIVAQMEQNERTHQASMMNIAAQGARDRNRIVGGYMQDVQDDAALRAGVVPSGWKVVRK